MSSLSERVKQRHWKRAQRAKSATRCSRCGSKSKLIRHHKNHDPRTDSGKNLEVLCRSCHRGHHNKKGTARK